MENSAATNKPFLKKVRLFALGVLVIALLVLVGQLVGLYDLTGGSSRSNTANNADKAAPEAAAEAKTTDDHEEEKEEEKEKDEEEKEEKDEEEEKKDDVDGGCDEGDIIGVDNCCLNTGIGPYGELPDCKGICGGTATEQACGCGQPGTMDLNDHGCCGDLIKDCNGECGGPATEQACGCGQPGTMELNDNGCCGDLIKDCKGVCGGSAFPDCSGVCGGDATDIGCGCEIERNEDGCCPGEVRDCETQVCVDPAAPGVNRFDCFGACGGTAKEDCAGNCNGNHKLDKCGNCTEGGRPAPGCHWHCVPQAAARSKKCGVRGEICGTGKIVRRRYARPAGKCKQGTRWALNKGDDGTTQTGCAENVHMMTNHRTVGGKGTCDPVCVLVGQCDTFGDGLHDDDK